MVISSQLVEPKAGNINDISGSVALKKGRGGRVPSRYDPRYKRFCLNVWINNIRESNVTLFVASIHLNLSLTCLEIVLPSN